MMTVEPSTPMEVDEPVPVPGNSTSVVPTTQETLEAEWLNEHRLDYQKGEKHVTNLQKKGRKRAWLLALGPQCTTSSMLTST